MNYQEYQRRLKQYAAVIPTSQMGLPIFLALCILIATVFFIQNPTWQSGFIGMILFFIFIHSTNQPIVDTNMQGLMEGFSQEKQIKLQNLLEMSPSNYDKYLNEHRNHYLLMNWYQAVKEINAFAPIQESKEQRVLFLQCLFVWAWCLKNNQAFVEMKTLVEEWQNFNTENNNDERVAHLQSLKNELKSSTSHHLIDKEISKTMRNLNTSNETHQKEWLSRMNKSTLIMFNYVKKKA